MANVRSIILTFLSTLLIPITGTPGVHITIRNLSRGPVNVYWLNPHSGQRVLQTATPIKQYSQTGINSFETHAFVVVPANGGDNLIGQFTVGRDDEFLIVNDFMVVESRSNSIANQVTSSISDAIGHCSQEDNNSDTVVEACTNASTCVSGHIMEWFERRLDEVALEAAILASTNRILNSPTSSQSQKAEKLIAEAKTVRRAIRMDECFDEETDSWDAGCLSIVLDPHVRRVHGLLKNIRAAVRDRSKARRDAQCSNELAETEAFFFPSDKPKKMETKLWNQPTDVVPLGSEEIGPLGMRDLFWEPEILNNARITVVDNFVSSDECAELISRARPNLRPATHAGTDGDMSKVSKVRDSQQAVIRAQGNTSDPAWRVQARSVALANHLSGYSLVVPGQENLMGIQYNAGQQYDLHCDGSCDGTPFLEGGRLATVLMYCATAESLGATSFPNAGVHLVPKKGQAVYFHFREPRSDGLTELWHTEHSGCPVQEGEKWVITQWLRDGVDEQNPWYRFSPFGGPA